MKYVISLGGSIIAPDKPDTKFLKTFKALVLSLTQKGHTIFLVCGGGGVARVYQKTAKATTKPTVSDLDWLGIAATRMNAELLRVIFGRAANSRVFTDPTEKILGSNKINIYSGWKPGWSTDYDAVQIAKTYGIRTVINLSNIDYVYDSDPKKNQSAKKITQMSWSQFRKMFGNTWNPGANVPFDPVAAKLAQQEGITTIIMSGKNLPNFKKFLAGQNFEGTVIG